MSHFEVHRYDAAGRLGELEVPRSGTTVRTPALLPVVNPHVQTLPPADMAETFGVEALITNAYVLHGSDELREPALERGLHELLDFDGAIVTDSGSFQLAEYGDIDVTTEEIVRFQYEIGADVGTPVDVPTPPDASRERAEDELATTQERIETAAAMDTGEMLLNAPVQGSTYPDLREAAGEHAGETGCDVFPVGAVVPLLQDYRFADLVDVVAAAKRGLPESAPVHCFGAGHPMMLALAVALGCDLFDSAAYALYARDERYLTVRGTEHLAELHTFPCECPVCVAHEPAELREMADDETHRLLARHNLHVTVGELRRIRAAIRDGSLLELVDQRARSHPSMCDGYRALLDHGDALERSDPSSKGTFFHVSTESARRPEVRRHQARFDRFDVAGDVLLTEDRDRGDGRDGGADDDAADADDGPAEKNGDATVADDGAADADDGGYDEVWDVAPPFGPAPPELVRTYPLTAEVPDRLEPQASVAAAEGVARFVSAQDLDSVTLAHRDWPDVALAVVPDDVRTVSLDGE